MIIKTGVPFLYSLIGICIVWFGRFIVVCHIVCDIFHTIGHIFDTIGYAVGHILNAVAYTIDNIINDAAAIVLRLCVITLCPSCCLRRVVDILRFVLIIVGCVLVSSATYKSSRVPIPKVPIPAEVFLFSSRYSPLHNLPRSLQGIYSMAWIFCFYT